MATPLATAGAAILSDPDKMQSISKLVSNVLGISIDAYKNSSLPSATKSTLIASRVLIQNSCAQEEVLPELLQTIQQLYAGWVLAAVGLSSFVGSSKTKVKDLTSIVATEALKDPYISTSSIIAGLESFSPNRKIDFADPSKDIYDKQIDDAFTSENESEETTKVISSSPARIVKLPDNISLPSGRIIEVTFNTAGDGKYTTNLLLNLYPYFVPDFVMEEFFNMNFKPNVRKRWFQVTTGEISFFKDFLFELDLSNQRQKALKNDKTGILRKIEAYKNSKFFKFLSKWFGNVQNLDIKNKSQNIANIVQIMNKPDFDKWCSQRKVDFESSMDRQKYMFKTMTMLVVVIDSDFQRIDMYFNGIDQVGQYSFNQLKSQAKSEKYDLASIMKAYTSTSTPRF